MVAIYRARLSVFDNSLRVMSFIFAPSDFRNPSNIWPAVETWTARKIHIRRLYDVLNICIQRKDFERATRAWCILARCKEVDWRTMWSISVHILAEDLDEREKAFKKIDFLRVMMLQHSEDVRGHSGHHFANNTAYFTSEKLS